jgi:hypothetical protein
MRDVKSYNIFFSLMFAVILFAVPCYGNGNREQQDSIQIGESNTVIQLNQRAGCQSGLIFIGVSPRLTNRDEAVNIAIRDAARKYSFFNSVSSCFVNRDNVGAGVFDIFIDSDYMLQYDNELDKFIEKLEYDLTKDVFENNNAVFVVTRINSAGNMPLFNGYSFTSSRPYWIDSPPSEIDGFIAGVGYSGRLSSHRDTVVRSYERAVIAIIQNIESLISREQLINQNNFSTFGFEVSSLGESRAYGTLENFYIIESWTNPVDLSVWTLALAKKGE